MVLDKLHEGGIEIASPNFMNTRAIPETVRFIPEPQERVQAQPQATPEEVIFDKAEKAAAAAALEREYESIAERIESLKEQSKAMGDQPGPAEIQQGIKELESRREQLAAAIESSRLDSDVVGEGAEDGPGAPRDGT